jgi:hypothetical protein
MRDWIGAVLIGAGVLAFGFAVVIWASIPGSDSETSSLIWFGVSAAIPGLAATVAGVWLMRSARQ